MGKKKAMSPTRIGFIAFDVLDITDVFNFVQVILFVHCAQTFSLFFVSFTSHSLQMLHPAYLHSPLT